MARSAECEGGAKDLAIGSGDFQILKEELRYSRYLNVYNRIVEYPPDAQDARKVVEYDIVGSRTVSFHFCAVMPFDSKSKLVTLIKEYAQGSNGMMFSLPCGGLSKSHTSLEDCAMKELSEEAHLHDGKLVKLIGDDHPGLLEVKWCRNRFTPYLILDPLIDPNPRPRDSEEYMEIVRVDLEELDKIMFSGQMMLPSIVTCSMGLRYLKKHHIL
ncbi:uncharacterized protein LOC112350151 [Selaginella moellendorffii]|uniref:uncharacterized protein LOC112348679 n=1 Tax=Selaginella moellendorffii TaxID=88036 RepID=UPI000D1CB11A|nr:uncharacterized protein LOC112348679 [Selaginella moellendorffii]XP_024541615.1 uncharacterized protein LOC112350151 [Selaginella moellendorffii]|eukprot:XP_024537440.1 uncharacterized protein LOC112348679 [Selaginella moellendorffii]